MLKKYTIAFLTVQSVFTLCIKKYDANHKVNPARANGIR